MGSFHRVFTFHGSTLSSTPYGQVTNVAAEVQVTGLAPVFAYLPTNESTACYLLAAINQGQMLSIAPQTPVSRILPLRITQPERGGLPCLFSPETGNYLCAAPIDPMSRAGPIALASPVPREFEWFRFMSVPASEIPGQVLAMASELNALNNPDPTPRLIADYIRDTTNYVTAAEVLNAVGMVLSRDALRKLALILRQDAAWSKQKIPAIFPGDISAKVAIPQTLDWLDAVSRPTSNASPAHAEPAVLPRKGLGRFFRALQRAPASEPTGNTLQLHPQTSVRLTPAVITIGTDYDALDREGIGGNFISLPFALNIQLRRLVEPRRRACVVATARNEGLYLLEWIAHHKAVGFDHLFIYSNDNTDGSDDLLKALAEAGEITWVNNIVGEGRRAQWKAYGHALRVMPQTLDYEWTLLIDLDEFFVPSARFGCVGRFLDWHEARVVDAIGINWQMVGPNGKTHWQDDLLARRFPRALGKANPHIKTMLRTRKFLHSYPHDPAGLEGEPYVFRNASGEMHEYSPQASRGLSLNPDISAASIAHFFFKSNEELVWKGSRNRGDEARDKRQSFLGLTEGFVRDFVRVSAVADDPTGLERHITATLAEMERLQSNQVIGKAFERTKRLYKDQIGDLVRKARLEGAIIDAGDEGAKFMSVFNIDEMAIEPL
jgi:hypothetical protein